MEVLMEQAPFTQLILTVMVMQMFLELRGVLITLLGGRTLMEAAQAGQSIRLMEAFMEQAPFTPPI